MRKRLLPMLVLCGALFTSAEARAEGGPFGLGVIIGSPTGASIKLYLNRENAIDAALGLSVLGAGGLHAHVDYLWHPLMLARDDAFYLPLYLGVGGRVLDHSRGNNKDDDLHLGVRGVCGILFDFKRVPIDVFLEAALVIDVIVDHGDEDAGRLGLNAGMGARYYF